MVLFNIEIWIQFLCARCDYLLQTFRMVKEIGTRTPTRRIIASRQSSSRLKAARRWVSSGIKSLCRCMLWESMTPCNCLITETKDLRLGDARFWGSSSRWLTQRKRSGLVRASSVRKIKSKTLVGKHIGRSIIADQRSKRLYSPPDSEILHVPFQTGVNIRTTLTT